ncbi:MAG: hypothetical protein Q4D63_06740, partial [Neisseria animaloris]|nr:hypothetical protein [Neisseria animaloris]
RLKLLMYHKTRLIMQPQYICFPNNPFITAYRSILQPAKQPSGKNSVNRLAGVPIPPHAGRLKDPAGKLISDTRRQAAGGTSSMKPAPLPPSLS